MGAELKGWKFKNEIKKTQYGPIYKTLKDGDNHHYYCTRVLDKKLIKQSRLNKYVTGEISILKEIKHSNCENFISFEKDEKNYYLITDYCNGGSVGEFLENKMNQEGNPMDEKTVQHVMRQVCNGLKYLHNKKILHRNLKLDHLMINYKNEKDLSQKNILNAEIKIVDFLFSRHITGDEISLSNVGSNPYKDPHLLMLEINNNKKLRNAVDYKYDEKIDIWSLGILCYEMLNGNWTFEADNLNDLIEQVEKGTYYLDSSMHQETVEFINSMLRMEGEERASAEELCLSPFLTKEFKNFHQLDPNKYKVLDGYIKLNTKE